MPQIYAGMWVRNGIQIKGQAMTYIQCHFCYSMADLDIFLLQVRVLCLSAWLVLLFVYLPVSFQQQQQLTAVVALACVVEL
jgi:hypothetical protein